MKGNPSCLQISWNQDKLPIHQKDPNVGALVMLQKVAFLSDDQLFASVKRSEIFPNVVYAYTTLDVIKYWKISSIG